ncbi:MAG: hypothetical protein NTW84_04740 [Methanothrix sp.]|nr:hypothetical protein [Methanothrix sp.]
MAIFIFVSAALISLTAASSSSLGAMGTGFDIRNSASTDLNLRNIENKMADSLNSLSLTKPEEKNDALVGASMAGLSHSSPHINGTGLNNSSQNNNSLSNASFIDPSAINASEQNSSLTKNPTANGKSPKSALLSGSAAPREMGSSSTGKYNGFYGVEASRHEVGKSDIKSKTLLSGGFEVDKTVQFQDRDF